MLVSGCFLLFPTSWFILFPILNSQEPFQVGLANGHHSQLDRSFHYMLWCELVAFSWVLVCVESPVGVWWFLRNVLLAQGECGPPLVSVGTAYGAVSPRKGWHYRHGRDPGGEVEVMTDWGATTGWWLELKCLREKVKWEEQWAERGILSQQQHWKLEGAQRGAVKRHLHRGEGCVTEAEQRSGVSEMRKWTLASKSTDGFSEIGTGEFPLDLEVRSLWP